MLMDWIYRSSLKRRIWVCFTALTVVCISVTGLFAYSMASRAMERNAMELNQSVLNKSVDVLDQKLKQIIVASSTLMLSEAYQQTMKDLQANNTFRYYTNLSQLQVPFTQAELTEKSIDSILISTPAGDFYPTSKVRKPRVRFQDTSLYAHIKEHPDLPWLGSHKDELFVGDNQVVSLLLQPLTDYFVPDLFVAVNVKEDMLADVIRKDLPKNGAAFMLLNRKGESVLQPEDRPGWAADEEFMSLITASRNGSFEFRSDSGSMLVNYAQSNYAGDWILVSYMSKAKLLESVRNIRWLVLTIMVICIVMALVLARLLSDLLLQPLLRLQKTMKRVERNELSARFQSPFQDEIGEAGQQFNRMLGTIEELIREVKATEKEKRRAEVKALQAQIDPHFLYNTLNTVFWKCEMNEYDDVKEMVISLSALFRLGLNNGQEITTLERELEHVRQYLNIQKKCYEELFDYTIEANPEWLQLPVLKILIQPLVENSILHGMKALKQKGLIRIAVERDGTDLVIRVTDNGMGMDAEQLKLRVEQEAKPGSGGYALSNVRSRLHLYYGREAELTFESEPYVRTEVVIRFPAEGGDKG